MDGTALLGSWLTTAAHGSTSDGIWVPAGAAAVVCLVWVNRRLRSRRRHDAVIAFAAAKGWQFIESDHGLHRRWPGRPFQQAAGNQAATNVLRGSWGDRTFTAFDYSYETPTNRAGVRFSVIALRMQRSLPRLVVEHVSLLDRGVLNPASPGKALVFESGAFNRAFRVTTDNEQFARAVIHPRLMEFLLAHGEIGWRIAERDLLGWDTGAQDLVALERRLEMLRQIADYIPPFVWHDYADGGPR